MSQLAKNAEKIRKDRKKAKSPTRIQKKGVDDNLQTGEEGKKDVEKIEGSAIYIPKNSNRSLSKSPVRRCKTDSKIDNKSTSADKCTAEEKGKNDSEKIEESTVYIPKNSSRSLSKSPVRRSNTDSKIGSKKSTDDFSKRAATRYRQKKLSNSPVRRCQTETELKQDGKRPSKSPVRRCKTAAELKQDAKNGKGSSSDLAGRAAKRFCDKANNSPVRRCTSLHEISEKGKKIKGSSSDLSSRAAKRLGQNGEKSSTVRRCLSLHERGFKEPDYDWASRRKSGQVSSTDAKDMKNFDWSDRKSVV